MRYLKKSMVAIALTALVAAPALSMTSSGENSDEWPTEPTEYWADQVDANDERAIGIVAMVDFPRFQIRTLDDGLMSFTVPAGSQYADDLQTGERVQVWFDRDDTMNDAAGNNWLILHGFGFAAAEMAQDAKNVAADSAADRRSMKTDSMKKAEKRSQTAEKRKAWDAERSVAATGLPTDSKAGPGPMAYTLTGTITELNERSFVLDTVTGPQVVRLVDATLNKADLEKGNDVTIQFHRSGAFVHAKVIENAADDSADTR